MLFAAASTGVLQRAIQFPSAIRSRRTNVPNLYGLGFFGRFFVSFAGDASDGAAVGSVEDAADAASCCCFSSAAFRALSSATFRVLSFAPSFTSWSEPWVCLKRQKERPSMVNSV